MDFLQEQLPWEPNWPANTTFDVIVHAGSREYKGSFFEFNAWRASRVGMQAGGFKKADALTVSHTGASGTPDFSCTFYACEHPSEYEFTYSRYEVNSSPFWVTIKEWNGEPVTLHISGQECEKYLALPGANGQTIVEYLLAQIRAHDNVWELPSHAAFLAALQEQGFSRTQLYYVKASAAVHFRDVMCQNGGAWEYRVQVRQFVNGKAWPEVL